MLESLQYLSILIEAIVAVLGLLIVFQKKKNYGIGIFTTFFVYVFYDLAKLIGLNVSSGLLYSVFFIATLSILLSVWLIYKESKNNKKR